MSLCLEPGGIHAVQLGFTERPHERLAIALDVAPYHEHAHHHLSAEARIGRSKGAAREECRASVRREDVCSPHARHHLPAEARI